MFNPGDRVRCIRSNLPSLHVGEIYTVRGDNGTMTNLEEIEGDFYSTRFQLVGLPVDNREEVTLYTIAYKHSITNRNYYLTYDNQQAAESQAAIIERMHNTTLLALKKFKTRI